MARYHMRALRMNIASRACWIISAFHSFPFPRRKPPSANRPARCCVMRCVWILLAVAQSVLGHESCCSKAASLGEQEMVPDMTAQKPDGWDDEEDGIWERPLIPKPADGILTTFLADFRGSLEDASPWLLLGFLCTGLLQAGFGGSLGVMHRVGFPQTPPPFSSSGAGYSGRSAAPRTLALRQGRGHRSAQPLLQLRGFAGGHRPHQRRRKHQGDAVRAEHDMCLCCSWWIHWDFATYFPTRFAWTSDMPCRCAKARPISARATQATGELPTMGRPGEAYVFDQGHSSRKQSMPPTYHDQPIAM